MTSARMTKRVTSKATPSGSKLVWSNSITGTPGEAARPLASTGVGIRAVTKKTNKLGQVVFKVRPKKKGKLYVTATKTGFQAAYGTLKVR